ncbi:OmpH family outer membrane protein [bacterium]|nr:OmpH family outer membrane protein [bacterium]MBU1598838.1 OmpH family outer membrane protein [bacterium]
MKASKALLGVMLLGLQGWGMNIAFIDSQKVFNGHPETKNASEVLNKEVEQRQTELKVTEEEILAMREELSKPLSEEARRRKEATIKVKLEELEKSRQSALSALEEKRTKLEAEINRKIYEAIETLAKEKGIDLVLDKNSVIYGTQTFEITDEIIEKMNPKKDETK